MLSNTVVEATQPTFLTSLSPEPSSQDVTLAFLSGRETRFSRSWPGCPFNLADMAYGLYRFPFLHFAMKRKHYGWKVADL